MILLLLLSLATITHGKGCATRAFDSGTVCVCNATYCDAIEAVGTVDNTKAIIYRTEYVSLARMDRSTIDISSSATGSVATLDPSTVYQEVIGFGGAFTDATGINIASLSQAAGDLLLQQYFGPTGTEYTVGRVPMASCDFSTREYSYDDSPGDFDLVNFTLVDEDFKYKIPYIKQAMTLQSSLGGLKLFSSPWSAPSWMKTDNDMKGGGELKGDRLGPYWVTWSNYFVKFFEAYAAQGVPFWGLTVQNEPANGNITDYAFQTMYMSGEDERDFVKLMLGPALKNSSSGKDLIIMVVDDNRNNMLPYTDVIFADEEASAYIAGMATHWYNDRWFGPEILTQAHENHPTKFILATEACNGWTNNFDTLGVALGNFTRAEKYAYSVITDMNNWATGWTDWNMALDMEGGPNWVSNFVDSPIIVNSANDEFYKNPMYYALAHFSKFLKPGAHRVGVSLPSGMNEAVQVLGAVDTEGRNVVVTLNGQDSDIDLSFNVKGKEGSYVNVHLPAHSIVTAVWNGVGNGVGSQSIFVAILSIIIYLSL